MINKLILGDNLEILKAMDAESVDLIYLDPPFFSNRNYEVVWGDAGEIRSFQDRWSGGMEHYIGWLYERVEQMHRVLKPTGSLYLHCDWHANAYIRVEILDKIFGCKNFQNEIVWYYSGGGASKSRFARKHDNIYFYAKSNKWTFNVDDVRQDYKWDKGQKRADGSPRDYEKGKLPDDVMELHGVMPWADERIGYPTQKPEALLERIIKASSNEGDLVLDPFMGGGTTIAVAEKLGRHWVGIDQSAAAVKVTELRLQKQADLYSSTYTVQLHKYDYDELFNEDPFEFEIRIIQLFGGTPHGKKGGDRGVDGKAPDNAPLQVKQSKNVGRNVVDNFKSSAERFDKKLFEKNVAEKKPVGYIIAFSFGRGAIEEVARLKNSEDIIIKLVTVEEIVPLAVKPTVAVHIKELECGADGTRKLEFVAVGESPAGVEFYSWDFAYDLETKRFKPSVIMDKDGKQSVSLKVGEHNIAVKVVDNDGLENIELVKLKINGGVNRE